MSYSRANLSVEIIQSLSDTFKDINILETGCIRSVSKKSETGDGHSTRHFCEFVRDQDEFNSVSFTSIDLDTSVCSEYLSKNSLEEYVNLIQGNTLEEIPNLEQGEFHFVYLDTANDPDIILNEFKLLEEKLPSGAIVVVDDAEEKDTHKRKGNAIFPYAQEKGYKTEFLDTTQLRIDIV